MTSLKLIAEITIILTFGLIEFGIKKLLFWPDFFMWPEFLDKFE